LFREGQKGTPDYDGLRATLMEDRLKRGKPHLAQLLTSLEELIDFSSGYQLRLGFENRFHYYELPIVEEMSVILETFQQPWVGWQFDIGHLKVHDTLGLTSFDQWLQTFGERIVGVHLHDVVGISDHRPPGTGEVDFDLVNKYLPKAAYRTLEVDNRYTSEQIITSLNFLKFAGCIQQI
jgi:sugar phosphate isomerase/epimerase